MKSYGIGFLIDLLKISPTQMAQFINVDRSLISKWKTGARKLDVNSTYFDKVLDYLILKNNDLGIKSLEKLFSTIYSDKNIKCYNKQILKKYLKQFIFNNDTNENYLNSEYSLEGYSYVASVPVYEGIKSKHKAMMSFLDIANKQEIPVKLTFIFLGEFNFLDENNFFTNWIERVLKLLDKGFKIDVIYSSYNSSECLIYLCKLIVHKNCRVKMYSNFIGGKFNVVFNILQNKAVLYGYSDKAALQTDVYAYIYTDLGTLAKYNLIVDNINNDSKDSFITYDFNSFNGYEISNYPYNMNTIPGCNDIYYYNKIFLPDLMEDELYLEILHNSLTNVKHIGEEFHKFKIRKGAIFKTLEDSKTIMLYSVKDLNNMLNQGYTNYNNSGGLSCPNLILTKNQLRKYMHQLGDLLLNVPNFHICLYQDDLNYLLPSSFCWCQKNENLLIYDIKSLKICCSSDISFITSVSKSFDKIYNYTYPFYKEKNSVAKFLKNL